MNLHPYRLRDVSLRSLARTQAVFAVPAHHLTTHGVVVGMTGSGKTGRVTVLVEEALAAGVPVLAIDVKGDLSNLLLVLASPPAGLVPLARPRSMLPRCDAS